MKTNFILILFTFLSFNVPSNANICKNTNRKNNVEEDETNDTVEK
jgi:hypothetical protein